jgi:putative redox protein
MSFTGTAFESGFEVPLDATLDVGGDDNGFRPMELIATGLVGCTSMDVISILRKKRQEITAFEVEVHAERAEKHPRVFTSAVIEYRVTGHNVQEAAVRRAIELSAERYCPAQAMFRDVFPIALKYAIFEAGENGSGEPVLTGDVNIAYAKT